MNFSAAALQIMLDKGLTLADVVEIAAANGGRSSGAERQARYRANKKARDVTSDVTPLRDPAPNERDILTPTRERKPKAKALVKKRLPIPDDWQPGQFGLNTESRKVVDSWPPGEQAAQLEQMKAYHRSKHNTFLDPQDAWSTWVLNTRKWGIGRNERSASPTVDAASRILRDLRANDPASQDPYAGGPNVHDDGAARSLVTRRH